jgi:hypothetical protein
MQNKPKRSYGARFSMRIEGAAKPRYFKSERLAIDSFRELQGRLNRPLEAEMTPVKAWASVFDPCTLQGTSSGAVVVRREARPEPVANPAVWWR